eukprot:82022-Amphidinium_carterae.1
MKGKERLDGLLILWCDMSWLHEGCRLAWQRSGVCEQNLGVQGEVCLSFGHIKSSRSRVQADAQVATNHAQVHAWLTWQASEDRLSLNKVNHQPGLLHALATPQVGYVCSHKREVDSEVG